MDMGIFDSYFSPQNYQGMGGLLSQLPMWQMQAGASQGFPGDQGALPPNAQPTSGPMPPMNIAPQAPAAPAAPEPGFSDRLMAGFQGFARGGGGLLPAIAGAMEGVKTGQTPKNMTIQTLMQKGMDENMARTVASDPGLLRAVLPQVMGIGGQTDDIKEYQFAKREEPNLTFQQFMQRKRAVSGEYSLTPQYGTNDKGETVLIQTGKSGEAIQTKLPAGVKISSGVDKVDLGTQWGIIDKRTGQMVGTQPKDIAGKEAAEARGQAQGQAQVALPAAINTAETSMRLIDEMISHPGRETATGLSGTIDPRNYLAGTDATNFRVRSEQMQGRTFLEAFQSLKGAGAITEQEGAAATKAIARLSTSQSDAEYLAALNELKAIITKGLGVARSKASGNFTGGAAPTASNAPAADPLGIR